MIQTPTTGDLSLYIHVPFCLGRCSYCHFCTVRYHEHLVQRFIQALHKELHRYLPLIARHRVISLYFGGGTPSLMPLSFFTAIMELVSAEEITLEANPEAIAHLHEWKSIGINRLSVGIQSFDDACLHVLGRRHTHHDILNALDRILSVFDNVSIDLMYDIPGQTRNAWRKTLKQAIAFPISHLSLYNLTIEPGTLLHRQHAIQHTSEESTLFLQDALEMLAPTFTRYEISAFCRNHAYSLHNVGYWLGRPFLGLGPSASSDYAQRRYANISNVPQYCTLIEQGGDPIVFTEELAPLDRAKELLILRLRVFQPFIPPDIDQETHALLEYFIQQGYLDSKEEKIELSERGALFYDSLAEDLVGVP